MSSVTKVTDWDESTGLITTTVWAMLVGVDGVRVSRVLG